MKEDSYNIPEGADKYSPSDSLIELFENGWHAGQCYDESPTKQMKCVKCGSTQFEVGTSSYWTGVRCPNCKYEIAWHDG